jgi:hypothetical protein
MVVLADDWDCLEVYDGRFASVAFGATETVIVVQDGLEVYEKDGPQSFRFANATIILRDVASYRFYDCGYQQIARHRVEWDAPTTKSEVFRPVDKADGVVHLGGCSLWTRNGSSYCEMSIWSRHIEVQAAGEGAPTVTTARK